MNFLEKIGIVFGVDRMVEAHSSIVGTCRPLTKNLRF